MNMSRLAVICIDFLTLSEIKYVPSYIKKVKKDNSYLSSLGFQDEEKVKPYWCVLKNLSLACWSSKEDMEVTEPLLQIPVTKVVHIKLTVISVLVVNSNQAMYIG